MPADVLAGDAIVDVAMADNVRVWEAQRALPEPVGKAVRQAFAALVCRGHSYYGNRPVSTKIKFRQADGALRLCFNKLPEHVEFLDGDTIGAKTFNLLFNETGYCIYAQKRGERLRLCDYMFPEVVAVFTPAHDIWQCQPDGTFAKK